jgi:hypothetical protein
VKGVRAKQSTLVSEWWEISEYVGVLGRSKSHPAILYGVIGVTPTLN